MKFSYKKIESLVSGNIRVDNVLYTPNEAERAFPNDKYIRDAISRAWGYHVVAKNQDSIKTVFI